jgi:non-heme chloroperoxidase
MPHIAVDKENSADIKLYYEDHGKGQPVVLIHGFPLNQEAWEKQKRALLTSGYRTISYDRRGFGRSDKPAFGYDYDTLAADLNHLITKLNLDKVILVGHSMGTGEITRYLAKYGSGRVSRAVMISALAPFLLRTEDNPAGLDKDIFDKIQSDIMADRFAYYTQFLNDFYNIDENLGNRLSEEVVTASWNTASMASPKGTYDCVSSWLTDFREDVKKIDVPTLLIHGESDRILPIDVTSRRLEMMIPNSRLVALEGAPHGIVWTHAEEINRELLAFAEKPARMEETLEAPARAPKLAFREQLEEIDIEDKDEMGSD